MVAGVAAEPLERQLLIPFTPVTQESSEPMRRFMDEVVAERSNSSPFAAWGRVSALPDWVWVRDACEIAFIPPRPFFQHDYRYALIQAVDGERLVVREGGMDGSRDIFRQMSCAVDSE